MKVVELIRLEESNQGTFGILKIEKQVFCYTLEPPALLNKVNKSSIPIGQYVCKKIPHPTYRLTYEVLDVPERTKIYIHPGNFVSNTEGCIILGQSIDNLRNRRAVLNSGATFAKFLKEMYEVDQFHLTIKEVY